MGALIVYLFKSGVCLSLLYLFYRLLLSKETFHRFNRIALLGGVLLSMILPLLTYTSSVSSPVEREEGANFLALALQQELLMMQPTTVQPVTVENYPGNASLFFSLLFIVYLIGVMWFILQTLWGFFRLNRLIRTASFFRKEEGITIAITSDDISAFSWMNRIIMSQKDWDAYGDDIRLHETGHIRNRHSLDLLFMQLCAVLHWFNPAIWLLKQELQNVHEFEADEYALHGGVNAKQYQLLLIKKAVGSQRFTSMTNSFNHSKLKKRITMMLKTKSNPWARLKYLYILPVSVLVTAAFARPEIAGELSKVAAVELNQLFPEKTEDRNVMPDIIPLLTLSEEEITEGIVGDRDTFIEESVEEVMVEAVVPEIIHNPETSPVIPSADSVVVSSGHAGVRRSTAPRFINSLESPKLPLFDGFLSEAKQGENGIVTVASLRKDSLEFKKPLIYVDGIKVMDRSLSDIDPDDVETFTVLKDKEATDLYGPVAENGVILITTKYADLKKAGTHRRKLNGMMLYGPTAEAPLIIVDGREVAPEDFENFPMDTIFSISILKDDYSIGLYGEGAKNGVMIITTKKNL